MSDESNPRQSRTWPMIILVVVNVILIIAFIAIVFFGPLFRVAPSTSKQQQPAPVKTGFSKGQTAQFGNLQVKSTVVQRNWQSNNQFIVPADGNEFTLVTISLKNTGAKAIAVSPADFTLDADGTAANPTIKAIPPHPLSATDLQPGTELSGDIIYEIKKDSTKITLQYQMYDTATQKNTTYSLVL